MKLLLKRYFWPKRHRQRRCLPVPTLRRMLGDRVRSAGVEQPTEPLPDEKTVPLVGNAVVALGQLAARQQLPKTTLAVIESDETGIGILRPAVDLVDDEAAVHFGYCTSTHLVDDDDLASYECELKDDGHDTCSAFGGEFTWPRETALAVTL